MDAITLIWNENIAGMLFIIKTTLAIKVNVGTALLFLMNNVRMET